MSVQDETAKNEMGLGIESIKVGKKAEEGMYRMRKRKFGRTYINILHDPRVVRGNTYAAFVIPSSLQMEFMRLKEEEERRKRMMKIPKKLPRVALLAQKKSKEEEYFEIAEKQEEPDSPQFKTLEEPDALEDFHYFFEDRPPTPKFIPLPPGEEIATQIEDGELFDFDLEVEPILQVLVGRSLVQATYELIEEDERKEYLQHKKQYEQKREFELINLQRMEAARQRREDEKKRRQKQVDQKKLYDIEIQKKLIAKMSAKTYMRNLKQNVVNNFFERGYFKDHQIPRLSYLIHKVYVPECDVLLREHQEIRLVFNKIINENSKVLSDAHKVILDADRARISKIIEDKELAIKTADENERRRIQQKAERTEDRRINRITKSITDNIINTKVRKTDITNITLCDIDELQLKSENVHCLGGQLGLTVITLDSILRLLAETNTISNENLNMPEVIEKFLEELLLTQLKDNQVFELRYLESKKFDFSQPPENEEKKKELIEFLFDYRRVVNKSLKLLIEKEYVSDYVYKMFIEGIAKIYFRAPTDPATAMEIDETNQEPVYLESIKKRQEEVTLENFKLDKMKKKIKLNFINAEYLKKKRDNVGGFIVVKPYKEVLDSVLEIEEIPLENKKEEEKKEEGAQEGEINAEDVNKENPDNKDNPENKEELNSPVVNSEVINNVHVDPNDSQNPEVPKVEKITFKMDFLNEAEVFQNTLVPIDTYILHMELSEWFTSLTVRSLRRVLMTHFHIPIELLQSIAQVKDKINNMSDWMVDFIMTNERYKGKTLIPFTVLPIIPVKEPEGGEAKPDEQADKINENH